jgi:isopentenyldiphosphate isomerase
MAGIQPMIVNEDMLIDTVDEHDIPRGVIRRSEALPSRSNFRVVHIFLFNRHNELLIQQLSSNRERHAGQWGSSVAGYLFAGETYIEAAQRRLRQELGVRQADLHQYGKTMMDDSGCKKFISLFIATCEGPFKPDGSQIAQIEFLAINTIERLSDGGQRVFTPTFLYLLQFYRA